MVVIGSCGGGGTCVASAARLVAISFRSMDVLKEHDEVANEDSGGFFDGPMELDSITS